MSHFWWEGKKGGGYGSLPLWIVEDKAKETLTLIGYYRVPKWA